MLIGGAVAVNPATLVATDDDVNVIEAPSRFVSRGGEKLNGALERFHLDVSGKRCLDAGAGSGGFTDCLLQHGASEVVAVDVGYGQFAWSLRNDPRVRVIERTNIRTDDVPGAPFDLIVADLSFIGLTAVVQRLLMLSAPAASWLLLVKPQFEAKRSDVPRGGVVIEPDVWRATIGSAAAAVKDVGFSMIDVAASFPRGAKGNQEFFILAAKEPPQKQRLLAGLIEAAIEETL